MNANLKHTILGVLLSVTLCIVIFIEFRVGFNMLYNHQMKSTQQFIDIAAQHGKASVSIEEISVYDEVPEVDTKGDVIDIGNYDIKLKLNGTLTDDSMGSYGKYTYSSATDSRPVALAVEHKTTDSKEFTDAVDAFWHGKPETVLEVSGMSTDSGDILYYQDSFVEGDVPVVYLGAYGMYYMFVEVRDGYLIISAQEPFQLSNDKVTTHFGDPNANPMLSHTYSDYETLAAENSIRALQEDKDAEAVDNPYDSGSAAGSPNNYTAESDNTIRKQMAALANYEFKKDGTSNETTYTVDITSEEAKKSLWELTSTTYSYERAGLKLSMLSGKRSAAEFTLSGNINNTIDAERPYVIIVKYLDSNSGLLGISVLDNREKPLEAKGVSTFSTTITPTKDNIDIQKISSVMFEVY